MIAAGNRLVSILMITVLKPSELKAETGKILDKAIKQPQYVKRKGVVLVITNAARLRASADDLVDVPRRNRLLRELDDAEGW